jgi:hypothetical protein
MKHVYLFICLFFYSFLSFAQELIPVPLEACVANSQLVVEGRVIEQRSFWNQGNLNIYTASKIEVYKIFKGEFLANHLEIITPGGTVGLQKEEVVPSLKLKINEVGVFMLQPNSITLKDKQTLPKFEPYASVQGFVKYDLLSGKAASVFDPFNSIEQDLYPRLASLTAEAYKEISPFTPNPTLNAGPEATPIITSFSPTTVTAGTATPLTIRGSNFGATPGLVGFRNADDGGSSFITPLASQIISWTDTLIVVEVPNNAGTGNIAVQDNNSDFGASSAILTVNYAQLNAVSNAITGISTAYPTQHVNRDGTGGMTWQMQTDFDADVSAKASFLRAFDTWITCTGTKINWTIGPVTTVDVVANDNINIIRFDNGAELPAGVLGRCTSRWSGCANPVTTIDWFVRELDIVFDDGRNWNYGPAAPGFSEFDFESVAVHELGHAHQLGHVISPGAIMHFSISNGSQNRALGINDLAGGNDVMFRNTNAGVCGNTAMTELPCELLWDGGAGTSQWTDALNWTTDAVPLSTDVVKLDNSFVVGSYTVNLNTPQTIADLEIDMTGNTVSLTGGNSLNITGLVSPRSGALNANGQLVLKANGPADYAQIEPGSGTIAGDVVNEWYFTGASGYRQIASPVVCNLSELQDDFNILNFSAGSAGSVWAWDENISNWVTPVGGSNASFNQATNVFLGSTGTQTFSTLPLVIDAQGPMASGATSQPLGFSSGVGSVLTFFNGTDGWNFVYNPYPSAIEWSLVEDDVTYPAELGATYYYWDANLGSSGAYASFNANTQTSVNEATNFIAKGKAFWVKASATPSGPLNFTDAMRTIEQQPFMKKESERVNNKITLSAESFAIKDYAYYAQFNGATNKYDKELDHLKVGDGPDASIYVAEAKHKMAFNNVAEYQYPLPFGVRTYQAGPVNIDVNLAPDFIGQKPRYIQNLTTGHIHDLQNGALEMEGKPNEEHSFLLLHTKKEAQITGAPFVYTLENTVGVNLASAKKYTRVEIYDVMGREVKTLDLESNNQFVELKMSEKGIYLVLISSPQGQTISEKVLLY